MAEVQKYSTIEELKKANATLQGSPSLLGMSMLSYPNYINAMRTTMFTSHLKQFLNLEAPDSPFVFTNTENIVGKYSHGYKKAKSNYTVVRKIEKFKDLFGKVFDTLGQPKTYQMFVYDEKSGTFDVISRKEVENLTENFGYSYDNSYIDSLKEGDKIKEGDILFKSHSYDDDMNYGYGKNINVAYTLDPSTSEDAAVGSRTLQRMLTSLETETISVGINNNDYLINLYGDSKLYKPLPYIGEVVSDILAVSRRQINNQLLFDFRDDVLGEILDSDTLIYCDKDVEIIDYTIYCNADEWADNPFYDELNALMISQQDYYQAILETCEDIMNSGAKYTQAIDYLYKRSKEFVDKRKKWRENDNVFGNIELEISMKRLSPLAKACKLTGRYGNKSVISEIREDEDMPYTKDGRRIDLLINLLAIINRTTSAVLMELFINGASYQVRQQMKLLPTREAKAELLFDYIKTWNIKEHDHLYKKYKKYSDKRKDAFLQEAIDEGIYINIIPMWEDEPIFYKCINALTKFNFLKEDTLYVKKWGREIRFLNDTWVGELYVL